MHLHWRVVRFCRKLQQQNVLLIARCVGMVMQPEMYCEKVSKQDLNKKDYNNSKVMLPLY